MITAIHGVFKCLKCNIQKVLRSEQETPQAEKPVVVSDKGGTRPAGAFTGHCYSQMLKVNQGFYETWTIFTH